MVTKVPVGLIEDDDDDDEDEEEGGGEEQKQQAPETETVSGLAHVDFMRKLVMLRLLLFCCNWI
jgi:hypothetical protein